MDLPDIPPDVLPKDVALYNIRMRWAEDTVESMLKSLFGNAVKLNHPSVAWMVPRMVHALMGCTTTNTSKDDFISEGDY